MCVHILLVQLFIGLGALQDGVDAENCALVITTHTFTIAKTAHVFSNNKHGITNAAARWVDCA